MYLKQTPTKSSGSENVTNQRRGYPNSEERRAEKNMTVYL